MHLWVTASAEMSLLDVKTLQVSFDQCAAMQHITWGSTVDIPVHLVGYPNAILRV